jgi:cystathionine beta-lyase
MAYDFDTILSRRGTGSMKWDELDSRFGADNILPLWVADMDFAVAPGIAAAVQAKARLPVYGYHTKEDSFFQAAIAWQRRRHGWELERRWLINTPGVVTSLGAAVLALTDPGDRIVIQPPVYPPFFTCVTKNGRQLVENPLQATDGYYRMNLDELEGQLKTGVKMLILCSPHNPAGRVWTRAELQSLGNLCLRYGVTVLADEIHSDLILAGHCHIPAATLSPEIAANTVTFLSPSKTFNIAGTYTSLVALPDPVKHAKYRAVTEALDISAGNMFGLAAAEAAYLTGEDWLDELLPYLEANADFLVGYVKKHMPGVKVRKPEGTYLAWLDFRELFANHAELKSFLVDKAKVGLNDGLAFGEPGRGFARLNFACPRAVLAEGLDRIAAALANR